MKHPIALLLLVTAWSCSSPMRRDLAPLQQDGPPTPMRAIHLPNRFFAIVQKSYWIPTGADSTVVPVVDTVMIAVTKGPGIRWAIAWRCSSSVATDARR